MPSCLMSATTPTIVIQSGLSIGRL